MNKGAPFVSYASKRVLRSVKKSEIVGFIGAFGAEFKSEFNSLLENKDKEVTLYNNIVAERHKASHDGTATITLEDVRSAIAAASLILTCFERSLSKE